MCNVKLKFSFLCLGLAITSGIKSQTHLQVHLSESIEKFPFNQVKEVQFEESGINVVTDNTSLPFLYSEITKINFGNVPSGIDATQPDEYFNKLRLVDNTIYCSDSGVISIYNILGGKVTEFNTGGDITFLPKGIYIAICNGKKLKFVKQ